METADGARLLEVVTIPRASTPAANCGEDDSTEDHAVVYPSCESVPVQPGPRPTTAVDDDAGFDDLFESLDNGDAVLTHACNEILKTTVPNLSIMLCDRDHVNEYRALPDATTFSEKNRIEQFDRTKFFDEEHYYMVWNPAMEDYERAKGSVTSVVHSPFVHFDAPAKAAQIASENRKYGEYKGMTKEQIEQQWDFGSESGSAFHKAAELMLNTPLEVLKQQTPITMSVEYGYFATFLKQQVIGKYDIFRTELRVNDWAMTRDGTYAQKRHATGDYWPRDPVMRDLLPATKVAGSADFICHLRGSASNELEIWDWKRSKKISDSPYDNRYGEWPCDMMPDCNQSHYYLQLNLYKWIIEHNTHYKITRMCIVVFHPSNGSYLLYEVPDLQPTIQRMMRQRLRNVLKEADETADKDVDMPPAQLKEKRRYCQVIEDFFATAHEDPTDFETYTRKSKRPKPDAVN